MQSDEKNTYSSIADILKAEMQYASSLQSMNSKVETLIASDRFDEAKEMYTSRDQLIASMVQLDKELRSIMDANRFDTHCQEWFTITGLARSLKELFIATMDSNRFAKSQLEEKSREIAFKLNDLTKGKKFVKTLGDTRVENASSSHDVFA